MILWMDAVDESFESYPVEKLDHIFLIMKVRGGNIYKLLSYW